MSQSSNSITNTNIFSELSKVSADDKMTSATAKYETKIPATDQHEGQAKKFTIDHHTREQQVSSVVSKTIDQPKFVSASEMFANSIVNVKVMPEISDEELLEMTIKSEISTDRTRRTDFIAILIIDSTMNTNNFPKSSIIAADDKMATTSAECARVQKRAAPDPCKNHSKRLMIDRPSQEERIPNIGLISHNEPNFISTVNVNVNARRNVQAMPEISDEELLEMAIQFEMKHPK